MEFDPIILSDKETLLQLTDQEALEDITYLELVVESPEDQHLESVGELATNIKEMRLSRSCIINTR